MKTKSPLIFFLFLVTCFLLLVYSFSQVDLNLTLSPHPLYQSFQKNLTTLGYFHRPLSTSIYISILLLITACYLLLARMAKKMSAKQTWLLIILATIILLPSYPAFSHDIFNNIFDARIVTKYGLSPWHYKALDFPADTWIRFMRWTHRPSVYPPIWIGLSLIPSFVGIGKFILTLGLFKVMAALAYLGSAKLIYKISQKLNQNPSLALSLYAFNPLVIVESIVNAHMETTMTFFALLSFYLFLTHKKFLSWVFYLTAIGIKFMTFYLAPVLVKGKKYLPHAVTLGTITTLAFIIWYGFQPWYILWTLPFAIFLKKSFLKTLIISMSLAALFWNIPLILFGDFNLPTPTNRLVYVLIPFVFTTILFQLNEN